VYSPVGGKYMKNWLAMNNFDIIDMQFLIMPGGKAGC
jgi:hypothetical protein